MLYYLSQWILEQSAGSDWESRLSALRVFRYITFRSAGAAITALIISLWLGPKVILWLKRLKFGQEYSDRAEESGLAARVLSKKGTPTMGGVLIVLAVDLSALLWAQWIELVVIALLSLVVLAGLGFYDDYAKITQQSSKGTSSRVKLIVQFALGTFIAIYLLNAPRMSGLVTEVVVPFLKEPIAREAAWLGVGLAILTIVGSSNAVNLTDGLDGLAIGCVLIVTTVFIVLTYIASRVDFAAYFFVPMIPGAGELTVFCSAMMGAGLGFLWFNCHPAQVFMGDTGSLALGGALGIVAVLIHQPLLLIIAGGVFVAEAASVMIQTGWFKFTRWRYGTGVRVFKMAPLHHHFEKMGWYESQVVTRFYILCVLCALLALSTLKLR